MFRKLLLVACLFVSLALVAQTSAPSNQDNTGSTQSNPPTVIAPATGGTAWTGVGPTGGVLLSTPLASFDTPQPTAGISLAGRSGISNSTTVNTGLQSTLTPSSMVYVYSPAISATSVAPSNENPATEAVSPERINDFGPSFSVDSVGAQPATGLSLAEVAAVYKARERTQTLRTYTNADVPKENAGLLTNISMASSMPPAPPQTSKPQSSANPPAANPQQSTSQPQESTTQSTRSNNPQAAQEQSENENSALPASSSFLPLLGLLGAASAGFGLWYKRRR